ncbi:MAG TPA: NUDIX domain-containing protein, partial [Candidatus Limnocylindrales bacterium]|nr:NUDIX domain-containing protein [Candidatus Limnocylindrales bacterium]
SVPKGEIEPGDDPLAVARREFREETGHEPPAETVALGEVRQKGGKVVVAWAAEGDLDPATARSDRFTIEWPPGSGELRSFPEVDRVAWFGLDEARRRINPAQAAFLDRLAASVGAA